MQALSTDQKKHLYEGGRIGVSISTGIPTAPIITDDDIIGGSFSIERNWTNGSNIEIGCADSSELIFSIDNHDRRWNDIQWEGARLTVVLDIGGEPLQAGIFTVDSPPRKLNTIQIKALDDMARFNKEYDSDLVYPASLLAILQDACSKCNVTLSTVSFLNQGYIVNERPVGEGITYHHIIAWVAELAGANAWIDHLGHLQLSWYGDNQVGELEIGPDERFSFEMADSPIQITGIIHRTSDIDYLVGSDEYALIIEGNPLLQENTTLTLSNILGRVEELVYTPFSFDILPYPNLWPGDIITNLVDPDNNVHQSVIMNHSLKLNRNSRIMAKGQTKTVEGYATGAPFTASQKRVLESVARIEASRQTSSMEQALLGLNELIVNSLGFYDTVIEEATGAKKIYLHDQPQLENSGIIWTMTEQGFSWTDEGWNGGNPVWKYGITSDGSMVTKLIQTVGILADWIIVSSESGDSNLTTVLQALDGQIALKVEQTDIDTAVENLEIGGRNLLIRHNEIDGAFINVNGEVVLGNPIYARHAVNTEYIEVTPGDVLTFSKKSLSGGLDQYWRWRWLDENLEYLSRTANQSNEFQWTVPSNAYYVQASYPKDSYPKIEKGTKATDWTPAPEDVDEAISTVDTKYSNKVAEINTSLDGITQRVESTETNITTIEGTVSSLSTRMDTAEFKVEPGRIVQTVRQSEEYLEDLGNKVSTAQLADFAEDVVSGIEHLQEQIDGSITTWFYDYEPTSSNIPANQWTTTEERNRHLGDLFYNTENGYAYRWLLHNGTYSWGRVQDTDITKALEDAQHAKDVADSKRRVFTAQPTPPYDVGDLWTQGANGELMRCVNAKQSGNYVSSDWEKAVKYTDDTVANANLITAQNYAETKASEAQAAAQQYAETKAEAERLLAEAYADGVVSAEEQARINDVQARLQEAKTHAETKASQAETAAKAYAELKAKEEVENLEIGGRNLIGHFNIIEGGWVTSDGSIAISSYGRVATDFIAIPINTKNIIFSYNGQDYPSFYVKVAVGLYDAEFGFIKRLTSADTSTPKTFTLPENVAYIRLSYPTELRAYDDYAKLETGNKATDWTPAPEDVDEAISTVDTKYSNKVAEINTTIDGITQRVESTETNITTINGIVAAHNTRLESAESKITPNAIVNTVRQSTAYQGDLEGVVENLEIGGRNLIGHFNIIEGGWVTSDGSIAISSYGRVATDFIAIPINTKNIIFSYNGQDYPSFYVKVAVGLYDAEFGFIKRLTSADTSTPKTFTLPENVAYIRLSYPTELRAYDDYAKLETGNKATDWTPAPEDVDEAISTVDGKVVNLESRVNIAEQKITPTAIVQTVRQSTGYQNDLDGKISKNNIISEINQSAEEVQINANRVKIGMGTTFEQGQIYTWEQYAGKTWNQMNS